MSIVNIRKVAGLSEASSESSPVPPKEGGTSGERESMETYLTLRVLIIAHFEADGRKGGPLL